MLISVGLMKSFSLGDFGIMPEESRRTCPFSDMPTTTSVETYHIIVVVSDLVQIYVIFFITFSLGRNHPIEMINLPYGPCTHFLGAMCPPRIEKLYPALQVWN